MMWCCLARSCCYGHKRVIGSKRKENYLRRLHIYLHRWCGDGECFNSVDARTRRVVAVKAMVHGIRGSHDQMHCHRRMAAPSECWLVESRVIDVGWTAIVVVIWSFAMIDDGCCWWMRETREREQSCKVLLHPLLSWFTPSGGRFVGSFTSSSSPWFKS